MFAVLSKKGSFSGIIDFLLYYNRCYGAFLDLVELESQAVLYSTTIPKAKVVQGYDLHL